MKFQLIILIAALVTNEKYQAVIAPTNNNIAVVGVDNPLEALIENTSANAIALKTNNGSISQVDNTNRFIFIPKNSGPAIIYAYKKTLSGEKLVDSIVFRCKHLSPPVIFVGSYANGGIPKRYLLAVGGILARLENSDFEYPVKINNYRVIAIRNNSLIATVFNESNRFADTTLSLIRSLQKDDLLIFSSVSVTGADGRTITISGKEFIITE